MVGDIVIPAIKGGVVGAILVFAILALFGVIFEANKPMSLGGFFRLAIVWVCIAIPVIFAIIGALSIKMSKRSMRSIIDGCIVSFASGLLAIIIICIAQATASITNLLSLTANFTRVPSFIPTISAISFGILTARLPPILKVFLL